MYKYLLALISLPVHAGIYVDAGLGVPLSPETGYTPDMYGIAGIGYIHRVDKVLSLDLGLVHRSLTGNDYCNNGKCNGDNAVETKIRLEW